MDKNIFKLNDLDILHVDMDAFYASVEEVDDPRLKGRPIIVGGLSSHGVVTTANYRAREYGVHSAMPAFEARLLCPYGIYLRPRMQRYRQMSDRIFDILGEFTDKIEKLSVDEAYLDVGHLDMDRIRLVKLIKSRVYKELGISMSIGLSYNKFLAKLASDWNKPDGFKYIVPSMLPELLYDLPVGKVYGIGPKSARKLNNIGIYRVEELLKLEEDFLLELFGKAGSEIYFRIRGVDRRRLDLSRKRKSLGVERTFDKSTKDLDELRSYLKDFSKKLSLDLGEKNLHTRTIIVKVKDEDFKTQTRSRTINNHIFDFEDIYKLGLELLDEFEIRKKIRLLGITAANLMTRDLEQLSLFD